MRVNRSIQKLWDIIKTKFEAIGTLLLLVSFGWQCFEDNSNDAFFEAHMYDINEKLDAIWFAEYNEVMDTKGFSTFRDNKLPFNYDYYYITNKKTFNDWNSKKNEFSTIEAQKDFGWKCRVLLYIVGSILTMIPKFRESNNK